MANTVYFPPSLGGSGLIVTDDASPTTGLGQGGHRARFVPALEQTVAMAQTAVNAAAAAAASQSAIGSAVSDALAALADTQAAASAAAGSAAAAAGSATAANDAATLAAAWAESTGEIMPGSRSAKYWAGQAASVVGIAPSISIDGPTTSYANAVATYTITDFDAFVPYTVSVNAGSVSRTGSVIYVTMPASAGTVTLTLTRSLASTTRSITVLASGIAQPTPIAPANGASGILPPVTLQASAFAITGSAATHLNSDWQVATDSLFASVVWSSMADATNKTTISASGLPETVALFWRVRYRATDSSVSAWSITQQFALAPLGVQTPVNVSPANSATGVITGVSLQSSAFAWAGSPDTHLKSDWQVATDAGMSSIVVQSLNDTVNKTSFSASGLSVSTQYWWRVRHHGTTNGASNWSTPTSFTTASAFVPSVPGTPFGGGYYVGKIVVGASTYAIIVAPASTVTTQQYRTTNAATPGIPGSPNDGWTNTLTMVAAGNHPAAAAARAVTAGGYTDWYLPSWAELMLCYRYLKPGEVFNATGSTGYDPSYNVPSIYGVNPYSDPTGPAYTLSDPTKTTVPLFFDGSAEAFVTGAYWTSTEYSENRSQAAYFSFYNGPVSIAGKTASVLTRAVRRILL